MVGVGRLPHKSSQTRRVQPRAKKSITSASLPFDAALRFTLPITLRNGDGLANDWEGVALSCERLVTEQQNDQPLAREHHNKCVLCLRETDTESPYASSTCLVE